MNMQLQIKAKAEMTSAPVISGILQRRCGDCRKKRLTMQRSALDNTETSGVPSIVHEVLNSPGQPLDRGTRAFMEPRFGHDFSKVRVHTDAKAAESARAVNAQAYTVGSDIVFGTGRYSANPDGKRLLAHELTHVVQQSGAENRLSRITEGPGNDQYEQEADCVTEQVMQGSSVAVSQRQGGVALHRRIGDGHDLTARRFSGNAVLEAVFDNEQVLKPGDSGTAVRLVQESLLAQGYNLPIFGADGDFGGETETAVRQFQINTGAVRVDGIIGAETMQLLDMHDTGTTRATGPRAAAPAAGAPAAPAATGFVFSEDPTEQFAGYDNSTAPNWLVVPAAGRRRVAAAIAPVGARPAITSLNPAISTVDATPSGVVVTGVAKGTTEIQAREGAVLLGRLQISVKDRLDRSVAFHYVCDSAAPPHCSDGTPPAETMRSLLNRVWERQANVRFTNGGVANVVAPGDLGPAVDWTSPGGGEWNIVTALGLGANYRVFRVWNYLQDGAPTNGAANLGNNTMLSDNTCADGLGLPHECGHYLGLNHGDGFIMTPCGGRADRRVSKAMVDRVNP